MLFSPSERILTRLKPPPDFEFLCGSAKAEPFQSCLSGFRRQPDQAHSVQAQPLVSQWTPSLSSADDSGTRGDQQLVFQAQDARRGGGQSRCPRWSGFVRGHRFLSGAGRAHDFVSCGRCLRRHRASGNFDGIGLRADRRPHDVDGCPPNPSAPLFRRAESCGPRGGIGPDSESRHGCGKSMQCFTGG